MIISASRRTDIPSYYSEWFFQRIKEQYVRSFARLHLLISLYIRRIRGFSGSFLFLNIEYHGMEIIVILK